VSRGGSYGGGYGGSYSGSQSSRAAARPRSSTTVGYSATKPTNFIEHATILKKLYPRAGQPERDTGWTVAIARDEATGDNVKLVGTYGPVAEGELLAIKNDKRKEAPWENNQGGWEYKVWSLDHADPLTRAALKAYLDNLPGVGDKLSDAIIDTFSGSGPFDGAAILAKIDADPTLLRGVRGAHGHAIRAGLEELIGTWDELRGERKEMLFLSSLQIGDSTARRIRKHFRELHIDPVGAIKQDPYVLVEVDGVGFRIADFAAKALKVPFDDPRRLVAGLSYVLEEAKERSSHICLTRAQLGKGAPRLLARDGRRPNAAMIEQAINDAVTRGQLVSYTDPTDNVERIYTAQMYLIETRLYDQLNKLLTHEKLEPPESLPQERPADSLLTQEQWQATVNVFQEKFSILTGGPGTGKTTSLKTMLDELDKHGQNYLCLAPTGKAAKRMSESTGRDAYTIHKALMPMLGLTPPRNLADEPKQKLDYDVIVIDETSMLDAEIAERLLSHVHERTRVVFVGDPDQLPPVGPGAVLLDLLEADRAPTAKLTQVFRQAEGSLLVVNAHRIKDGLEPFWSKAEAEAALGHSVKEDFILIETGSASAVRAAVLAQVEAVSQELNVKTTDVLVTSPFRAGEAGVFALNKILQDRTNPLGEVVRDDDKNPLRVGDVVMNTKNLYAKNNGGDRDPSVYDVMNGDMGYITDWDEQKKIALINFGDGEMKFQSEPLARIVPAYAATVHKLQGSQGPGLVMPLTDGDNSWLVSRNHVYTGMTRAEEKCVMIVDAKQTLIDVLGRSFERETTLDLRVGRIEKRLKSAWEQVQAFETKWQEYTQTRQLPKLRRPSALAAP
jgi:exodeoxyribonuclease V alpha subunit